MAYLITAVLSYLLGSLNPAYFLARFQGIDLKTKGSGNLGASNATATLGWRIGIAVAVFDIAKGAIAVTAARLLLPQLPNIGVTAGLCAVFGHIFPFYLRFRGGKGFASYLGMTVALNWKLALCAVLLALIVTVITDYIALGTISTVLVVPGYLCWVQPSLLLIIMLGAATAVIFFKHRDNFARMRSHTEIGLRSTVRGENKVKKS